MQRVLLFGGSFDPIHHGHLLVARATAEHVAADRVLLIPSARPPHKLDHALTPAEDRCEMCRLAVGGDALFDVSRVELERTGPSFTIDTVEHFRAALPPETELCWLIGGDSLAELHTWRRVDDLVRRCRIVTAVRAGFAAPPLPELSALLAPAEVEKLRRDILPTPQIDISATDIRRRVSQRLDIRYLTPEAVCRYIEMRSLYAPPGSIAARDL